MNNLPEIAGKVEREYNMEACFLFLLCVEVTVNILYVLFGMEGTKRSTLSEAKFVSNFLVI